jgi:tryptophanyl-tRNA synthetase
MRILSGIQPSGRLHLGNYFGALKQHIEMQEHHDCFYFIANYHALTTVQDPKLLHEYTRGVALDYLALGLDPNRVTFFRQSDVPEVCELTWILDCVTGTGLLERAHAYKDKVARGIAASMGLFCYPVLMAADILIYKSQVVPVGRDQVQHVEMAQDMAGYFNAAFRCDVLTRPEAKLGETPVVPGVDGQKMSKSYNNAVELFAEPKTVKKAIMSIKTDSTPVEEPKDPAKDNVFALLKLFASEQEAVEWDARYRKGGMGYGEAKKRLFELFEERFAGPRQRRAELLADPSYVDDVLDAGGKKARAVAQRTLVEVLAACGLATSRLEMRAK